MSATKHIGFLLIAFVIVAIAAMSAAAASTYVPPTTAGDWEVTVTANDLKPGVCASIYLDSSVEGDGGNTNELIFGTDGDDKNLKGGQGNDCINWKFPYLCHLRQQRLLLGR